MKRYTYVRSSIFEEHFVVEAESEAEALNKLSNGDYHSDISDWLGWYDDEYTLENVDELKETA